MAQPMGMGRLGAPNLIIKRKFRWTLKFENICGNGTIPEHFVKLAARPNLTIEETEINFLHAKSFLPGKATWESITVTYYDVATRDNKPLWDWLASVYNFTDPVNLEMGSLRSDYAGTGVLMMFDGCGTPLEQWVLNDAWPQAINFGELDYSNSEEATIELTLRYSQVDYKSLCPDYTINKCCTPCGPGNSATLGGGQFGGNFVG